MFKEIVEMQHTEYLAKQTDLIEGHGGNFKALVDGVAKLPGMSFGEPPYIVDDGENALLLINADGNYSRLAPDFYLSEESVNEDYDAIYTVPSLSTGAMLRLIPANSSHDFADGRAAVSDTDNSYYAPLDELFEVYMSAVVDLARQNAARDLMRKRTLLLRACEEDGISFADVIKAPRIARAMHAIFANSLTDASEEIIRRLCEGDEEEGSDD